MTSPRSTPLAVSRHLAGLVALVAVQSAIAQTDLRWRLAPDDQLELMLSQTSSTEADIAGKKYKSSLQIAATLEWRILDVDAKGVATIEQRLSHLSVAAEIPGAAPVKYDSSSQERLTGAAMTVADEFRPILGRPVRVRLLPTGEIDDSAREPGAPEDGDEAPAAPLTANDIRQLLGRLLPTLPPAPVAPHDSWGDCREQSTLEGKVQIGAQYVARGTEMQDGRPVEKIDATYEFSAAKGKEVALEFTDQNHRGAFYFNAAEGRLARGEIRQSMTLHLRLEAAQVSQKANNVMTIEVRPRAEQANH
jgi:hypothetical protein